MGFAILAEEAKQVEEFCKENPNYYGLWGNSITIDCSKSDTKNDTIKTRSLRRT